MVARDPELRVVAESSLEGLASSISECRPDAVLINHDTLPSIDVLGRLARRCPETGFIVSVMSPSRGRDRQLLAAGAMIVVPLTAETADLCAALRLVARGLVGPRRCDEPAPPDAFAQLTPREENVCDLLLQRLTAAEIATQLHISATTVNTHRRHIYEKLGVHSRQELALAAQRGALDELGRTQPVPRDRLPFRRHRAARASAAGLGVYSSVT
jgi:DNA-binding NarL/FixJ family response regulator